MDSVENVDINASVPSTKGNTVVQETVVAPTLQLIDLGLTKLRSILQQVGLNPRPSSQGV